MLKRKRKVKYYVYYGHNTSREECYSLADVNFHVAHFLKSGVAIREIVKVTELKP